MIPAPDRDLCNRNLKCVLGPFACAFKATPSVARISGLASHRRRDRLLYWTPDAAHCRAASITVMPDQFAAWAQAVRADTTLPPPASSSSTRTVADRVYVFESSQGGSGERGRDVFCETNPISKKLKLWSFFNYSIAAVSGTETSRRPPRHRVHSREWR